MKWGGLLGEDVNKVRPTADEFKQWILDKFRLI